MLCNVKRCFEEVRMKINKMKKQLLQWILAVMMGFLVVNLLCFGYDRPTGWIDTPHGPSPAGWNPESILVHGTEGFSISQIDKNGYDNLEGVLNDSYILCMGSSHTQGHEVKVESRYTSILNEHFSKEAGEIAVYNIACQGHFLPSLVKYFPAALEAFPNANTVTIELSNVDFPVKELEEALQQVEYKEEGSVVNTKKNFGIKDKLKMFIKEYFPLISLIKSNIQLTIAQGGTEKPYTEEKAEASAVMQKIMKTIRSQYTGEIIFIYHPVTNIEADGTVALSYGKNWSAFQEACQDNGIHVIDMGDTFMDYYEKEAKLPYGFANTTPGTGHLNAIGHGLIADELIQYIEEVMP